MTEIIRGICLFALALGFGSSWIVGADEAGSVCIAPVEKPADGAKSLANPSGGNQVRSYTIQIDGRPAVKASAEHGVMINDLDLAGKHIVKVKGNGKNLAAFRFQFADYASHNLCMWFKPLYETWSLTPAKGHGKGCICHL